MKRVKRAHMKTLEKFLSEEGHPVVRDDLRVDIDFPSSRLDTKAAFKYAINALREEVPKIKGIVIFNVKSYQKPYIIFYGDNEIISGALYFRLSQLKKQNKHGMDLVKYLLNLILRTGIIEVEEMNDVIIYR